MFPGPDNDPLQCFTAWLAEAQESEPNDPNAMTLATVDDDGQPSARMVLLKGADETGFVFYTNLKSRKGRALAVNRKAALLFHWKSRRRQVRVEGSVNPVAEAEADAYFASRARQSQIGAWASDQSATLPDRFALEKAVARYAAKYAIGRVPRPPHWSGFRLVPQRIEFWQDGRFRLHDRAQYDRDSDGWSYRRLYP